MSWCLQNCLLGHVMLPLLEGMNLETDAIRMNSGLRYKQHLRFDLCHCVSLYRVLESSKSPPDVSGLPLILDN